ncbi:dehydrogenase/reductase SDR family member 1-like isoform X3 [Argopecten irradians]|uniref:dehydrogenase/reductase SDR family member 1-like isoform X3 n=1 Tax=Argopecten irradians TaxID=31199 RepID=UPI00371CC041
MSAPYPGHFHVTKIATAGGKLAGKVCIVTGATRGIGKGIALQLGEAGATVYITGRTLVVTKDSIVGGSLTDTAREVEERGGKCIPVQCDHTKDEEIQQLFDKVKREQEGQLDILVNNAYSAVKAIFDNVDVPFWEFPMDMWDTVNNVGLRNHYLCTIQAAKMMVPRKRGLIVNISSIGGLTYTLNVPYGIGKEAGNVNVRGMFEVGESIEYAGKAVSYLASDPNIMKKTGKILITAELGSEYGFVDINGREMVSFRNLKELLMLSPKTQWIARLVPRFIYIPKLIFALLGNKF